MHFLNRVTGWYAIPTKTIIFSGKMIIWSQTKILFLSAFNSNYILSSFVELWADGFFFQIFIQYWGIETNCSLNETVWLAGYFTIHHCLEPVGVSCTRRFLKQKSLFYLFRDYYLQKLCNFLHAISFTFLQIYSLCYIFETNIDSILFLYLEQK